MENLTSQLSLRSLDESGRPPTAGRSSSLNRTRAAEFGGHLERARTEERDASETKDVEEVSERDSLDERGVEEGRTDRAESGERSEETREDGSNTDADSEAESATSEASDQAPEGEVDSLEDQATEAGLLPMPVAAPVAIPTGGTAKSSGGDSKAAPTAPVDGAVPKDAAPKEAAPVPATSAAATAAANAAAQAPVEEAAPRQAAPVSAQAEAPAVPQTESQRPSTQRASAPAAPQPTGPDPELVARAESVLSQVKLRFAPGMRSATINLNPAELGKVRIEIKVEAGSVRAELRVETPEALAALERQLPELKAMFAQDGVDLTEIDLGLASEGAFDQDAAAADKQESKNMDKSGSSEPAPEHTEQMTQALADAAGLDLLA